MDAYEPANVLDQHSSLGQLYCEFFQARSLSLGRYVHSITEDLTIRVILAPYLRPLAAEG